MPTWIQAVLGAAALVTALGVLWRKVVRPAFKVAKAADELVPLLRDFTEAFRGTPQVFLILDEIASQFRTDGGSSLLDIINKLRDLTHELAVAAEAARQLSAQDRITLARLGVLLADLDVKADARAEDAETVADRLAVAQAAVDGVAADLAESHARADAADPGDAGSAADAALRTQADPEERIP